MVQFVFTPWRDRAELLRVRGQLYPRLVADRANTTTPTTTTTPPPSPWWSSPAELRAVEAAVARVLMWAHRGGCPHVVESTALLMSAMVFDARGGHDAVAGAAVAAGYLVGFTRFVTGLLDGHQDKARKLSMYGIAKTIGLPAAFVELRHQGTHEPMPSLAQLRPAAARALVWIWEYYWKNLPEGNEDEEKDAVVGSDEAKARAGADVGARRRGEEEKRAGQATTRGALEERMCRNALVGYLQRQEGEVGEDAAREGLMRQLERWDDALAMRILVEIGDSARDRGVLLRSVKLSSAILSRPAGSAAEGQQAGKVKGEEDTEEEEELRRQLYRARDEVESGEGRSVRGGGKVTGKRKKDGEDGGAEERKRSGWYRWEGPWTTRPIGVL